MNVLLGKSVGGDIKFITCRTCPWCFFFPIIAVNRLAVHVSAVLHVLVAMTTNKHQIQPSLPSVPTGDEDEMILVTYLCQWKVPKKRKESNFTMSETVFEKQFPAKKHKLVSQKTLIFDRPS